MEKSPANFVLFRDQRWNHFEMIEPENKLYN